MATWVFKYVINYWLLEVNLKEAVASGAEIERWRGGMRETPCCSWQDTGGSIS